MISILVEYPMNILGIGRIGVTDAVCLNDGKIRISYSTIRGFI